MMKKFKNTILLILLSSLFISSDQYMSYRKVPNTSFIPGEVIKYKVHYGFVNAAEGEMVISDKLHSINGRKCYKIDVYGKSIGMFDVFLRIRDNWGVYLDSASIIPQKSYRYIEEGKYRKKEIVKFDHFNKKASVIDFDKHKEVWKEPQEFEMPTYSQEMVSGYYFLRTLDFKNLKENEIVKLKAFFDDEVYDFNIRFIGREEVKTKLGKIRALVLSPIMPENSLFDGENSIRVWISDDKNKVPLKVKAEMFVGAVEVDILSYDKGDIK